MDLDTNVIIIIACVSAFLLLILLVFIGICVCLRRRKTAKYKRTPDIKLNDHLLEENSGSENKRSKNDDTASALNASPSHHVGSGDDVYKFLGISLNDLPFIDDSKYSSIVDLTSWNSNPYKQLTNNA